METTLRTLYQLQQIDSSLDEFEEMKGDLPSRIASLDEEIGKISEKIQQQEHRMNEAIVSRNKADTDIVDLKEKLEKYKGQQYQVRNNKEYDAITKEIEVAEKTIITLQDEFAALENVMSVAKNDVEQLSVQLLQLKTEREEKQKEYDVLSKETEADETRYKTEREKVIPQLEESVLSQYERIRKARRGKAVVTLKRGACGGCNNKIPTQHLAELRKNDRVYTCQHCGRIVISQELVEELHRN